MQQIANFLTQIQIMKQLFCTSLTYSKRQNIFKSTKKTKTNKYPKYNLLSLNQLRYFVNQFCLNALSIFAKSRLYQISFAIIIFQRMNQQTTLTTFRNNDIKFISPNNLKHHYLYRQRYLTKCFPIYSLCCDGCCFKFQCCDTSVYKCWPVDIYENSHTNNYQTLVGNLKCRVDVPCCCGCICCCNCYRQTTLPGYVTKSYIPWCLRYFFHCIVKYPITNEKDEQIGTVETCNICYIFRRTYIYDRNGSYLYQISKICCQIAGNHLVMNSETNRLVQYSSNQICCLDQLQTNMPEGTSDEQKLLLLNAVPYLP